MFKTSLISALLLSLAGCAGGKPQSVADLNATCKVAAATDSAPVAPVNTGSATAVYGIRPLPHPRPQHL